jgi:hypothetical protein
MTYAISDDKIGWPAIASTDTVQRLPEGTISHAIDPVLGGGEFIYLKGVAGTVAGSVVNYDQMNHTTTLGPPAGANSGAPVAFAMSANLANQWGWYQITGNALAQKDGTALVAGGTVGFGTIAGTVGAQVASKQIDGAKSINIAATGATTANLQISRPTAQGAIT